MAAQRIFYIVQGSLQICELGGDGGSQVFADNDDGLQAFDRYLAESAGRKSLILVDVIEEVFTTDTVPKLGIADRNALLRRRLNRKFPRTPYKQAVVSKRKLMQDAEQTVVYSSISNHELVDPWLAIIIRHQAPLTGIFSVPLMAADVLPRIYQPTGPTLFITQHQGDRLRQVFIDERMVRSARLSRSPSFDDDSYAEFVVTEIQRSRRYLERSRLLSAMEQLDVCMITSKDVSRRLLEKAELDNPVQFYFVEPASAARKLRVQADVDPSRLESLYVVSAMRSRPGHSYAMSGETRYWRMGQIRRSIIGAAAAAAAGCSIVAGVYLGDAWALKSEAARIDSQVTQLAETYRRENNDFAPIRADSYEMKLAVDTGDFILDQRIPVPWVMQQLGSILGDYPDIRINELSWESQTSAVEAPARARPGEPPAPVPISPIDAVTAELSGRIEPFDGDMRKAFERIDRLVADISARTAFVEAQTIEYPVDASLRSSVAGEVSDKDEKKEAHFRLRLTYPLTTTVAEEGNDETA